MAITSYATAADLGRFGVNEAVLADVPADDIAGGIAAASEQLDGYLRSAGYVLPLVSVGDDVKMYTSIIAAYHLLSVKGFDPEGIGAANLRLRYEDALKWLGDVGAGKVVPEVVDSGTGAAPSVHPVQQSGYVVSEPGRGFYPGWGSELVYVNAGARRWGRWS